METKQDNLPIITFREVARSINYGQIPNQQPVYQRDGGIWKPEQEQLLMDSILRGIDIPKIYLRKLDCGQFKYEVIDGQQRIRALLRFLNDQFALDDDMPDLNIDGQIYPLARKRASELDDEIRIHKLFAYPLTVVTVSKATEDEVAELFYRLNNGTPLTAAEVRNSMPGAVTYLVRELAKHSFFLKCAFKNKARPKNKLSTS